MSIKVINEPSLIRDEHSKAIINTDNASISSYLERRAKLSADKEKLNNLVNDVDTLKNDMTNIKSTLDSILVAINNIVIK
jgi:hypothetical protein